MGGAKDDARVTSGGSRWGIKGSSEVSEGLTAVYKFETRLDAKGEQSGNKIHAGLSGGFGSLTVGRFNNAAYLSGGIRDVGNAFGDHDLSGNGTGSTVSYAYSAEAFTLQVDAIMNEKTNTDKAVDQVQFGLAVNLGDIGKVAIGYEKDEDEVGVEMMSNADGTENDDYPGYGASDDADGAKWMGNQGKYGYKASHISASFGLGSMTARLGYSVKDTNMTEVLVPDTGEGKAAGAMKVLKNEEAQGMPAIVNKKKTTFVGATGSIGETGMDWRAFGRKVEGHNGMETNPWGLGVGKALGGGAYTYIEHQNDDDGNSGKTQIGLNIDF